MNSLSWVEVNTQNLKFNVQQVKKLLPAGFKIAGVVKGNAYGHGLLVVADYLAKNNLVDYLATANDLEALALRKQGIKLPIIVLSYWDISNLTQLINNNIEFGVYNQQHLQALQNVNAKKIAKAHLKIDTGMSRLGLTPNEVWPYFKKLKTLKQVQLQGVFSHLAVADEDVEFTKQQIDIFKEVVAELQKQVKIPLIHLTNSAGSSFMQDQSCCNLLRLGLALYGLKPSPNYPAQLKPALSFKTKIIQIKNVPAGAQISYGLTHRFTQPAVIAVLPIGYADGYDRGLSGCGEVLIKGQPCPVRGRVCMNLTMVELSAKIKTKVGEEVVLIGQQGQNQITADEIAQKISTINYEIVTRINPQIKRVAI